MLAIDELVLIYDGENPAARVRLDGQLDVDGCALCHITHDGEEERADWISCRREFGVPVVSFHRDDLPLHLEPFRELGLPAVLAGAGGRHFLIAPSDVIERCRGSVEDLRARIVHHAARSGLHLPERPAARRPTVDDAAGASMR